MGTRGEGCGRTSTDERSMKKNSHSENRRKKKDVKKKEKEKAKTTKIGNLDLL